MLKSDFAMVNRNVVCMPICLSANACTYNLKFKIMS